MNTINFRNNNLISEAFNSFYNVNILSTIAGPEELMSTWDGYELKTKHLAAYVVLKQSEGTLLNLEMTLDKLYSAFYKETEMIINFLDTVFDTLMESVVVLN